MYNPEAQATLIGHRIERRQAMLADLGSWRELLYLFFSMLLFIDIRKTNYY